MKVLTEKFCENMLQDIKVKAGKILLKNKVQDLIEMSAELNNNYVLENCARYRNQQVTSLSQPGSSVEGSRTVKKKYEGRYASFNK